MFLNKIKIFYQLSILFIIFFISCIHLKSQEIESIIGIAKVIDGDTIKIDSKKIRLFGIDAPEKKQFCKKTFLSISSISFKKNYPCGEISTNFLKKKIDNKIINCKSIGMDRYKRHIAECFKGKKNINAFMVQNGQAVAYRKYSPKFISYENNAKKEKLGLWSGTFEMPWDYRKKN